MNAVQRYMVTGIGFSLFVFIITAVPLFITYPLPDWSLLWEKEIMGVPFLLFMAGTSIAAGAVFGIVFGFFWQKQWRMVMDALRQLEYGQPVSSLDPPKLKEAAAMVAHIQKIQKQMAEQVKLSQRLANEKAEEQEKRIQDIISQERHRLARELHDSVSQQLFAASMLISAINETKTFSDEREEKQFRLIEEMIHQSQLEMRALLLHLRPVALKGKSLKEGIQELLMELRHKVPLHIEWKVEDIPLDKGVEDHLFRILQESISNTLRHAKATKLEVLLVKRDQLVILRVSDDGVGFHVDQVKAGSYGLQNMHERALEIGGTLQIVSVPNQGTRLEVKVPMIEEGGKS
ncbi:sensor histidine kinase [Parageobacillus thermoglucosidasius]|uniref:Sensor histidine kinase n=1 Tax=Geobacillus sp. (strain Y4.1MC1) TaxID=581103 RepID=A0A7U4DMH0_GEOS0|nr:sensor histidine kinase [Parageobacillus thermoglucosidasius]AEH49711.1 putative signal transduction histidine kinase [Parageobacillus thermoglucosidasius C56-YS93]RDE35483.1 sensor histidine kinase [Parageobacillus thermoglucosidasius]BDG33955.1 sensor histidine kinase [Parageobacillus thermoglucosidasius]